MWYAIDFGTSNSLLSFVKEGERPRLLNLENEGPILRSLIFTPEKNRYYFGNQAIEKYQELGGDGRLFRSLKKFLPEPGFTGTEVFGKRLKIEDLIATILRDMKTKADQQVGHSVENVVLGRPALYSLDPANDQLAEDRMRAAAEMVGFKQIEFCPDLINILIAKSRLSEDLFKAFKDLIKLSRNGRFKIISCNGHFNLHARVIEDINTFFLFTQLNLGFFNRRIDGITELLFNQTEEIIEILPASFINVSNQNLSDNPHFWGGRVTDERYVIIADNNN